MIFKALLVTLSSLFVFQASAVEEALLPQKFPSEILPYMLKEYKRNKFTGVDRLSINYYSLEKPNPDGVLIISPGQSESSLKYAEVLYDLRDLNYSVFIIDHRGQGESGRLLPDPVKSHVNKFSDYVDDFSQFVNLVIKPQNYRKSILIAHSMGGAVASGFLARYPKSVTAAILFAPMIEINTGFLDNLGADLLAGALNFVGRATDYSPTQKPYNPNIRFEEDRVTSSWARFNAKMYLYNRFPQLRVGGATVNWVKEALEFTWKLRNTPNVYQVPTLLLQAGKDTYVRSAGQNQICEQGSPLECHIVRQGFESSKHEILMEQDFIRERGLSLIRSYIGQF